MLPAIWGGIKAASIGQRVGVFGFLAALLVGLFTWGWFAGKSSCETAHKLELLQQALAVGTYTAARDQATEQADEAHQAREAKRETAERIVYRKVVTYVQAPEKNCLLDPEYVRLVDELMELRTDSESRVLEAEPVATGSEELQAERAGTTQLLLAFTALSNARNRDAGMIQFMQEADAARYDKEMRFWNNLPPEARGSDE